MPYTNDDAYTEGWNDAMKEMNELKKENVELKKDCNEAYRKGLYSNNENVVRHINNNKTLTCDLQTTRKENEKLKRQIEKLKEQALCNNTHDSCCMCDVCEKNDKLNYLKDLKDLTITQLQKENEKLTIEASKGKALEEFICNGQGWGDFIEGITDEDKQDLIDAGHDKYDFEDEEEEEDSLPFGVMAWTALQCVEEDLCEFNTIEEGKEYIKNMGDDRDYYDKVVVFDRTGYNAEIDNADTITILYEWEGERMYDWKAGEFCCVDYKFRGKCSVCNEDGRWVALDKDDEGNDEPVMCCYGCDTGIDDEEEE